MKRIALLTAALMMSATVASAGSIVGTAHDLSSGYGGNLQGSSQICNYCHTPHNPVQNVPLWNRYNPSSEGWTYYNSPTLSSTARAAQFTASSISLFCMSCHDGVTALGNIKNNYSPDGGGTGTVIGFGNPKTNIGGGGSSANGGYGAGKDLSNDHPVGFSYQQAYMDKGGSTGGDSGALHSIAAVKTAFGSTGIVAATTPFYGSTETMECASCHNVHNNIGNKFLRKDNTGSALCLACHNK